MTQHTITDEQMNKVREIRDIASGWNALETSRDFRKIKELCDAIFDTIEKQTESAWQDISTAPRDGSRVLLWSKECNAPHSGQFYGTSWGYECAMFKYQPTHWMPLPLPPQKEIKDHE